MIDPTIKVSASYRVFDADRAEVIWSNGFTDRVYRAEIDLTEKVMRQALIDMGWTPPCTESAVGVAITRMENDNE